MSNPLAKLNPRVVTKQVGVKKLYDVNIYPLSYGDEMEVLDIFSTALVQFFSMPKEEQTEAAMAQAITEFIKTNLPMIIKYCIDEEEWSTVSDGKDFMKCLDNVQLLDIIATMYDMNFGEMVQKKAMEMMTNFQAMTKKIPTSIPTTQQPN